VLDAIRSDITSLQSTIGSQFKSVDDRLKNVDERIEGVLQYQRKDNIIISGVPFKKDEDVYGVLRKIGEAANVPISKEHVSIAHRLPVNHSTKVPPIIVKFVNRWKKDEILQAKIKISASDIGLGSNLQKIYFNDHLTPHQSFLFSKARALRDRLGGRDKSVYAWVVGGKIFFKKGDEAKVAIVSIEQLNLLDNE